VISDGKLIRDYKLLETLGRGSFGKHVAFNLFAPCVLTFGRVKRVVKLSDMIPRAMKTVSLDNPGGRTSYSAEVSDSIGCFVLCQVTVV